MAERSLREFYDCEMIFIHQCDPPPVIAKDANYMSLWQLLSYWDQEKLQRLLKLLEPVDQDRLLRVMDGWKRPSWSLPFSTPKSTLLNVLTRIYPIYRSCVLRLLEPLNQQEQERFVNVLDVLEQSEQVVELLGILNEHEVLEQRTILKVLNDLCGPFRCLSLKDAPNARTVLSQLKGLHPLDRLNLVRLLEGLDYTHQCMLLSALEGLNSQEQHRMLEVVICLERLKQQQLLRVLKGLDSPQKVEVVEIMSRLEHQEQQQLLRVLNRLDSPQQKKVLEMMVQLEHQKQRQLLRVLKRLDFLQQKKVLEMMARLEHQDQRRQQLLRLLNGPNCLYQCTLLIALGGLDSQEQHKILEVLMVRLEPQEQRQLLRVLEGLPSPHKVEFLEMMVRLEHQEQRQLLRVLEGLDYSQLIVQHEQYSSPLQCKILEIVNRLEVHEQQELLSLLVSMEPLERRGVLKVMYEFHTTGSLTSNSESSSFGSGFKAPILRLLNLLQRQQSIHRSSVEEYLDGLDSQEQKQVLTALDGLDSQERMEVEIFRLLVQLKEYRSLLQRLVQLFVCLLSICLSEDSQRGGFRNLLLDGWWLEFWEIILLAAGDVERNPGPTFMTEEQLAVVSNALIGESNLSGVFDEVRPVSSKWYQLCNCLGILASDLDAINTTKNGDCDRCLNEGLKEWLRRNYNTEEHGSPTWRKLVAAVDNSAGGNNHVLALTIAKKHKALPPRITITSRDDHERFKKMSSAFNSMYRSAVLQLRDVKVSEVKACLCYLTVPDFPTELCVPRHMYERATSTEDLLRELCPTYINPRDTFVLEEIVRNLGSSYCKRLVNKYVKMFCN